MTSEATIPPGPYLLAMTWFQRRTGASGADYLRCKFEVVSGPAKGRGFFANRSVDTSKPGVARLWELWMEQVRCQVEIDLASDRDIATHIKGRAFKGLVKLTRFRDEPCNDIDRHVYPSKYTQADWSAVEAWDSGWDERAFATRDPSDPGPQDADAPAYAEPAWSDGSGFGDDEIPF